MTKTEMNELNRALQGVRKQMRRDFESDMHAELRRLDAPSEEQRSRLPDIYKNPAPHRGALTAMPNSVGRSQLGDVHPDVLHWSAEWIRGISERDHARMRESEDRLAPFARATTVEGVAGANGAESTGSGGALVPRPLEQLIHISRDRVAKGRRLARVYPMSRQNHQIPSASSMTASMVAESTSSSQGEPTFASIDLIAKTGCVKAIASWEILADSDGIVVDAFAVRGGGALGVLEDDQVFKLGSGTGDNITSSFGGVAYNEATSTILGFKDIAGMYFALPQQYRDVDTCWLAPGSVLNLISQLRGGSEGRPLYAGIVEPPRAFTDDPWAIGSIFGRPVYEVPMTPGRIWFGSPSTHYAFGDRQRVEVAVSRDVRFMEREVVFLISERFAGNVIDSTAAVVADALTSGTNAW